MTENDTKPRGKGRRPKGQRPDWEGIKREWIAGQLSIKVMAKTFDVSESALGEYARRNKWPPRNLSSQVRQQAAALLIQSEAIAHEEGEAVDQAAARAVEVIKGHRKDLRRLADMRDRFIELLENGRENGKPMLEKVVSLEDARDLAQTLESLTRTTARLIPLERQAFNLDEEKETDAGDFLERLKKGRERASARHANNKDDDA